MNAAASAASSPSWPSSPSLAGFQVGVTSDRRSAELIEALRRRGAGVLHAPALRIAPVEEDHQLVEDTRAVLAAAPDVTVVTTAYGMRRWLQSADAAGLGEELLATLGRSRVFVRGPKARGAVRAAGLDDDGISPDERTAGAVDLLLEKGVTGRTVVVQLHGYADTEQLERLRQAGARVLTVAPYRWVRPEDDESLPRLIRAVVGGQLDVVTFTSAPAVDALVSTAGELGLAGELVAAMARPDGVLAAAVGPVTAAPLRERGVEPLVPERHRMGALIRVVCEALADRRVVVATARGRLEVRGQTATLDGVPLTLAPAAAAMLRALAEAPGAVVTREALSRRLPAGGGDHALDVAISRLRAGLPDRQLVRTVVKRGYRLVT